MDYKQFTDFWDSVEGEAYHANYDMGWKGNNPVFTVRSDRYKEFFPEISTHIEEEDGKAYVVPVMKFPSSIDGDDLDYADSFEYIADAVKQAAKFCTYLMQHPLDLSAWEDED